MLCVVVVTSCGAAELLVGERDYSAYTFADYKAELGKSYGTAEEEYKRSTIFAQNLDLVKRHNAQAEKTWWAAAHSPFADWTHDEFNAQRTGGTLDGGDDDNNEAAPVPSAAAAWPASLDWRDSPGVVTAVRDQGSCGSCWAFSAVETMESHFAIATNASAPVLSEQQVVSCSPNPRQCGGKGGCDGSTQPLAFNYTRSAGLTTEADYKYKQATSTCDPAKVVPVVRNTGYVKLPVNSYGAMMDALQKGPVAISVAAGSLDWQFYGGGIYNGKGLLGACGYDMDHGVQMVAYGVHAGKKKAKEYWVLRNSWGTGWGEKGFMRLRRYGEGKEPCGEDTTPQDGDACKGDRKPRKYCGVCAVLSSSSYPTGVHKA